MSFSVNVLDNIKTMEESEDEESTGMELLEPMKAFEDPTEVTEMGETLNIELKQEPCIDPLLGNMETFLRTGFPAEYQEQDFLNEHSDEDPVADSDTPRNKRSRMQSEYRSRSGQTWSTTRTQDSTADMSIQQLQPLGKGPAHNISNPLEAWHLLIDERILTQLVCYTNEAIRQRKGKAYHERPTDAIEMRAWLGLNYLCGIFRNATQNGPLDELWSLELGNAIFRATMSVKRFEFLATNLRCAEEVRLVKKGIAADFALVQNLWEKFVINCRSYYAPSGNCAVDVHEMRGSDTKPGAQLLTICDAKTLYMCNAIVSTGSAHTEPNILRLIGDIKGTKRNLVLSERHTSLPLAAKLLQCQLTMVGVLPASAKELPHEPVNQRLYAGANCISPMDDGVSWLLSSGLPSKVNTLRLYHLSCDACQHFHEAASAYSTLNAAPPSNNSWTLRFFHQMLDYAAINAWVLLRLSAQGEGNIGQRDFQRLLGLYLTQQLLKKQLQLNSRLSLPQKLQISEVLGEPTEKLLSAATMRVKNTITEGVLDPEKAKLPEGIRLMPKIMEKRARCRLCRGKNSPKTKTQCQQCLRPLCQKHFVTRCKDCTGVKETSQENELKQEVVEEQEEDSQCGGENSNIN